MNHVCNCVTLMNKWESYYHIGTKLEAVDAIFVEMKHISSYIEWMTDMKMLSFKQCAKLILEKENVERQLGGIKKALQNRACQMQ